MSSNPAVAVKLKPRYHPTQESADFAWVLAALKTGFPVVARLQPLLEKARAGAIQGLRGPFPAT